MPVSSLQDDRFDPMRVVVILPRITLISQLKRISSER